MFVFRGRAPVYIVFVALTAWPCTPTAFAQQRVPLTIAEAEDLAIAAEPGLDALLARAAAMEEASCLTRCCGSVSPISRSVAAAFPLRP